MTTVEIYNLMCRLKEAGFPQKNGLPAINSDGVIDDGTLGRGSPAFTESARLVSAYELAEVWLVLNKKYNI